MLMAKSVIIGFNKSYEHCLTAADNSVIDGKHSFHSSGNPYKQNTDSAEVAKKILGF
jgi:hypothetical protein